MYLEAVGVIHRYGRQMAAFWQAHDILLTATLAEPPAEIGRFDHRSEDYVGYRTGPDGVFAYSPFTAAFNATGQPAASLPLHWTAEGLPVGVHLAARFGADETLIALSRRGRGGAALVRPAPAGLRRVAAPRRPPRMRHAVRRVDLRRTAPPPRAALPEVRAMTAAVEAQRRQQGLRRRRQGRARARRRSASPSARANSSRCSARRAAARPRSCA